jgi:hypothetical protein
MSSSAAVSFADHDSASRKISTARWRGQIREFDRLARLDDDRRLVARRRGHVEQAIRVRLQPRQVDRWWEVLAEHRLRRPQVRRHDPLRTSRDSIETGVGRDAVQPRPEERTPFEGAPGLPRLEERVLDEVVGIIDRAEHPIAVDMERAPVALAQVGARVAIARTGSRDGGCLFGSCRGSNRIGSDRHRHDRFDGGIADQSSVTGETSWVLGVS